jgi:hypothetical protein
MSILFLEFCLGSVRLEGVKSGHGYFYASEAPVCGFINALTERLC